MLYAGQTCLKHSRGMLETYDLMQKNIIFMKVDMLQLFDIKVDYVDADGD